jgi:hypothetical protein
MGGRATWVRVTLAVIALSAMVAVPRPANAHWVVEGGWPPGQRDGMIYGEQGFCVHGQVTQEHRWHQVSTHRRDCSDLRNTWHTQFQQYYKVWPWGAPGAFCFSEGWKESPDSRAVWTVHYPWDIWHWCNNGAGVNVILTIDSWQYSWQDGVGYKGGVWRPATRHCHCP